MTLLYTPRIGVFSGGFSPSSAKAYETWLGRVSDVNVDFVSDVAYSGTDSMEDAGWMIDQWKAGSTAKRNMIFSIPLTTHQDPSLLNVATGKYDPIFTALAKTIKASYPKAVIRIGWEFNGGWYPWSASGRTSEFVAAFRRISRIFKRASADFTIDWCPTSGNSANLFNVEACYPGDDVVDTISLDLYNDYRWGDYKDNPTKRWEWIRTCPYGLDWQLKFAAAHKKQMGLPEWSVNKDDPYFIERVYDWVTTHPFRYVCYWDSNSAFQGKLSGGQYPNAASTYKRLFGSIPVRP